MLSYHALDTFILGLFCSGLIVLHVPKSFKITCLAAYLATHHMNFNQYTCPLSDKLQACKERVPHCLAQICKDDVPQCVAQMENIVEAWHGWDRPADPRGYMQDCEDECTRRWLDERNQWGIGVV